MPRYRRYFDLGKCYFLTLVTKERLSLFSEPEAIPLFGDSLNHCGRRFPFSEHAHVFLADHVHLILEMRGDHTPADLIRCLKRRFLCRIRSESAGFGDSNLRRLIRRYGTVWQQRYYDHVIRDEQDFIRYVEYIHYNPVKHGLVNDPFDWKYSSLHQYAYERGWGEVEPQGIVGMELE